jgi:hypothetical protein
MRILVIHLGMLATAATVACGGSGNAAPTTTPACDASCQDGVAILALREAIKDVYNKTLQGQRAGGQDAGLGCPLGGTAQVSGTASSTADQGTTNVNLTYVFKACEYVQIDMDPTQTFQMTLDGTVNESGAIAEQPSSTTALIFDTGDAGMTFSGTVYAPPVPYTANGCALDLAQNGNNLSGTICTRTAGTSL